MEFIRSYIFTNTTSSEVGQQWRCYINEQEPHVKRFNMQNTRISPMKQGTTASLIGVINISNYLNFKTVPSNFVCSTNFSKFFSITSLKISSASSGLNQKTE